MKDINNIDEILRQGFSEFNPPAPEGAWDAISKQIANGPTPPSEGQGVGSGSGGQAGSGIWQSLQGLSLSVKLVVAVVGIGLGIGTYSLFNKSTQEEIKNNQATNEIVASNLPEPNILDNESKDENSEVANVVVKEDKKAAISRVNPIKGESKSNDLVEEKEHDILVQTETKNVTSNKVEDPIKPNGSKDEPTTKLNKAVQEPNLDNGNLEGENEKGEVENSKQVDGIQSGMEPEFGNAISPDGDGKNDVWEIKIGNTVFYRLSVYDRKGQLVFETEQTDKYWNGSHFKTGVDCETGSYSYVVEYQYNKNEKPKVKRGIINLFR